jgi:hypothetical protein
MAIVFISMHKAGFGMDMPFLFHRDLCPKPFDSWREKVWNV